MHLPRLWLPLSLLAVLPLGLPAFANEKLTPVLLRVRNRDFTDGRSFSNGQEVFVPLKALNYVGAIGRPKEESVQVVLKATGKRGELRIHRLEGQPMLALSELAAWLDAKVMGVSPEVEPSDKKADGQTPAKRFAKVVYLLAKVTSARLSDGQLEITTSFPVPYRVHTLPQLTPPRSYVDCLGATLAEDFRPGALPTQEKQVVSRLRAGQNSPEVARIVLELAADRALKSREVESNRSPLIVAGLVAGELSDTKPAPEVSRIPDKADKPAPDTSPGRADKAPPVPVGRTAVAPKRPMEIASAKVQQPARRDQSGSPIATAPEPKRPLSEETVTVPKPPEGRTVTPPSKLPARRANEAAVPTPAPTSTPEKPPFLGDGNAEPKATVSDNQMVGKIAAEAKSPSAEPPSEPEAKPARKETKPPAPPKRADTKKPAPDRGDKPSRGGAVRRPLLPVEIRGLQMDETDRTARLTLFTGGRVAPQVRYERDASLLVLEIPNAVLRLPEETPMARESGGRLVRALQANMVQEEPPVARIALEMERVLGFSVKTQENQVTLELRQPRNGEGSLAGKLIVVDPGHGGSSSGAVGRGGSLVYEKHVALAISLKLRRCLEAAGARVVMTRDSDVDVPLYDRPRLANAVGADFFVSIHNDSSPRVNSASGTSTYYHLSDPNARALAVCIQREIVAVSGLPSRGAISDGRLYANGLAVLRASRMPAVLVEVAYINHDRDRAYLVDADFQQRVAQAICDGLRRYIEGGHPFGIQELPMETMPDTDSSPMPEEDEKDHAPE